MVGGKEVKLKLETNHLKIKQMVLSSILFFLSGDVNVIDRVNESY